MLSDYRWGLEGSVLANTCCPEIRPCSCTGMAIEDPYSPDPSEHGLFCLTAVLRSGRKERCHFRIRPLTPQRAKKNSLAVPVQYVSRKLQWAIIVQSLFLFLFFRVVQAEPTQEIEWKIVETKHTVIEYQSPDDLNKLNARIKFGESHWGLNTLFASDKSKDMETLVANKVDTVFEKVQEILGMRRKMKKVTIHVYQNRNQLNTAYEGIYARTSHIRAWYRFRDNTVYLNLQDLHEGMLAHELAHAIIDNYLAVRPPRATAEILARYVDSHLKR